MISIVGGLILVFWEIKFHPSYRQLWMVPFGLIIFLTPVLACFAVFISDIFRPKAPSNHVSTVKQHHPALLQVNSQNAPFQHV